MKYISMEYRERVACLSINRAEAFNALNRLVLEELHGVISSIDTNETWCLIIRGAGNMAFAAGADIGEMQGFSKTEAKAFSSCGNKVFGEVEALPIPVIAAISGYALGGGCELALACDVRICSEKAIFGMPETGLGVIPGFGGTWRLPHVIGITRAKEFIFSGRRIDAKEAERIGLVNKIFPSEELFDSAWELAQTIVENAPIAVRNAKRLLNRQLWLETGMKDALDAEQEAFSSTFETNDQREAMDAFVNKMKRKPFTNS